MIHFSALAALCSGTNIKFTADHAIHSLFVDSRKAIASAGALFFAIHGERHDGHGYIPALYAAGIRQFVVEQEIDVTHLTGANVIRVASAIAALQQIAAQHRNEFSIPVIGVTGSNGKTILKEWLFQLLSPDLHIVKNPGSYNSQTGVPLSVWQLKQNHQIAIFEAGISQRGEMEKLEKVIRPTIGIFTNIGTAHDEGFEGQDDKIAEKCILFRGSALVLYCSDQRAVAAALQANTNNAQRLLSWGAGNDPDIIIIRDSPSALRIRWKEKNADFGIRLPFEDPASVENAGHAIALLLWMNYAPDQIQQRITQLRTVPMRLELKQGINGCQVIDDSYNNDLAGLQISLEFLKGIQQKKTTVILSDILQSGLSPDVLMQEILALLKRAQVTSFIGIGPAMTAHGGIIALEITSAFYPGTEEFLRSAETSQFRNEVILVKGARPFLFEKIVRCLQKKIHGTVMEIDLGAMVQNLNAFRSRLKSGVKLMAMVKAFAYGSGSEEVANLLQYHGIDYLGVAYPDEGIELRKNNIRLPVMVMNPSVESFDTLLHYALEPEIYSMELLLALVRFLDNRAAIIHLKLDTGMHRLGFEENDLDELINVLKKTPNISIASIFSHLSGADEKLHDGFTHEQALKFTRMSQRLQQDLQVSPILHILNSSGILRFPEYQLGMVRLGIGLYGIDPTDGQKHQFYPVATLKTVISQIKTIPAGESVGYGRMGRADRQMVIATLAIGYADGFSRSFSRGIGEVLVHGRLAPVVGNVCMDMTMVDITGIPAREGDEVIIYGPELPIADVAKKINTIPYEILTGTSERVKRVFFAESI